MLSRNDRGNVYDKFRNRIMFPIRDKRGRTVAFGGRVLTDEKPKYLNSPKPLPIIKVIGFIVYMKPYKSMMSQKNYWWLKVTWMWWH